MRQSTQWLLTLLIAVPITGFATDDEAEKTGKQLYYDYACYACHGYQGIGKHNLANGASGILSNEQVFLIYLRARADAKPGNPVQTMPSYPANTLSDADAKKIFAYINTFRDNPPPVEDIPALQGILDDLDAEED